MKTLLEKTVYITGGSSGIGLETAKQVFAQGAHVVAIGRDKDKLHRAVKAIDALRATSTQKLNSVSLDVGDNRKVETDLPKIIEDNGIPDVLVLNAGIGFGGYFEDTSYDLFDRIIKTNLYGVRNVIAVALPKMKTKGGKIVIVSSMAGLSGMIGYSAYATSKFALVGFAQSIKPDLKRYGIEVTLVCPPEVETPLVVEEAKTIPPETKALKKISGLLSAEQAGKGVLKAIKGNSFLVVPGLKAKFTTLLIKYLPGFVQREITNLVIARNRKDN